MNLHGATLHGADLTGANLTKAFLPATLLMQGASPTVLNNLRESQMQLLAVSRSQPRTTPWNAQGGRGIGEAQRARALIERWRVLDGLFLCLLFRGCQLGCLFAFAGLAAFLGSAAPAKSDPLSAALLDSGGSRRFEGNLLTLSASTHVRLLLG